ncbi:hypothetical protein SAMN04244548_01231 [Paracoccus pantotrophus]|nr:hypothetical protein SAMN04244548_01231 [Paracoccus pantotrophus]
MNRWLSFPCACAFAKSVGDKNPFHFPRVGMADNVLYRGNWIIEHRLTGQQAVIVRPGAGVLHAEADKCCFDFFDQSLPPPASDGRA